MGHYKGKLYKLGKISLFFTKLEIKKLEITSVAIKLIILMIPGTIATVIMDKLTIHKEWKPFRFIINSIILGIVSYLFLQLITNSPSIFFNVFFRTPENYSDLEIWKTFLSTDVKLPSILIAAIATFIENNNLINKIAFKLRLTTKYGHQNLYSYYLEQKDLLAVNVRLLEENLIYSGYIKSFSEEKETYCEIVLTNVRVYTCKKPVHFLFKLEEVYLSLPSHKLNIERALVEPIEKVNNKFKL
jgi:hypothetical protein